MYEGFYGFQATPFTRGIPGDRLFLPPELSEVVSRMEYVSERHLFAVLTGDSGTGKQRSFDDLRTYLTLVITGCCTFQIPV